MKSRSAIGALLVVLLFSLLVGNSMMKTNSLISNSDASSSVFDRSKTNKESDSIYSQLKIQPPISIDVIRGPNDFTVKYGETVTVNWSIMFTYLSEVDYSVLLNDTLVTNGTTTDGSITVIFDELDIGVNSVELQIRTPHLIKDIVKITVVEEEPMSVRAIGLDAISLLGVIALLVGSIVIFEIVYKKNKRKS